MFDELFDDENAFIKYFKDNPEASVSFIKTSRLAYWYCKHVKDIPEMREKITEDWWRCWYYCTVKERQEMLENVATETLGVFSVLKRLMGPHV